MNPKFICFIGMVLMMAGLLSKPVQAAGDSPDHSAIPPITPQLLGWKIDKGTVKVLEDSQKGPDGGPVVRLEGEASLMTQLIGFKPNEEKSYTVSFAVRRLSPGDGWAGCVQVLTTDGSTLIRPLTYQKRFPAHSEEWTKVSETFKTPPNATSAQFQIASKSDCLIEVSDIKCTYVPAESQYR